MNSAKKKILSALLLLKNKTQATMSDKRGFSHLVEIVIAIIGVVVVAIVVFLPQITGWFTKSVMPSLGTETTNLFNFKG